MTSFLAKKRAEILASVREFGEVASEPKGFVPGVTPVPVSGKVLDPDSLALPGATVVVTNVNTGFTREVVTAETGAYSVPNLEPGTYDVAVTMAGFGDASHNCDHDFAATFRAFKFSCC